MYREPAALRFSMSPIVSTDRMCCSQSAVVTRFLPQSKMFSSASHPEQVFDSKDFSTLEYHPGLGMKKKDQSEGSSRQNPAISCVNAAKSAAEMMKDCSSTTSGRSLPDVVTHTAGLGVQYPLALGNAPVSGAVLAENQERMEELQALAKLAALRQGRILDSRVFRQTYVIRSYEVCADGTTSIDTLLSLFQEVALNHVSLLGIAGDGFGATLAMNRYRLIWVITRLHVEVERYPSWPEVVEIDSWTDSAGKNGMRRDWVIREHGTGATIAKATSTWAMINQDTRRLSKMPDDVRIEISPTFVKRHAMDEALEKIPKLDHTAKSIESNLTPRRTDLDGNLHVNNVTYVRWVMESTPKEMLETRQLSSITLEYRRECNKDDVVESLTDLEQDKMQAIGDRSQFMNSAGTALLEKFSALADLPVNGNSMCSNGTSFPADVDNNVTLASCPSVHYTHLLRKQLNGDEIVRGRTVWKPKDLRPKKGKAKFVR